MIGRVIHFGLRWKFGINSSVSMRPAVEDFEQPPFLKMTKSICSIVFEIVCRSSLQKPTLYCRLQSSRRHFPADAGHILRSKAVRPVVWPFGLPLV